MNEQTLNLRDIHLPEAISWWPLAPGWWILFACFVFILTTLFFIRKFYQSRQIKRDIKAELKKIKQTFEKTQNKSQLAKSLSILLRRANITYNPGSDIAGLTGENWLTWLDNSHRKSTASSGFQSDTGRILLSAPYLPEDATLDFDAKELIHLCESWLFATHSRQMQVHSS